ncbi:uncharacterized protein LOC109614041 [Musca domestica]|uniref:Regulatory protein zeste n=1 Tax=Musca domestica TaxID=7370 RepID=A0A9J7IFU1_MUSDO|nr:uncharacterized protein LOC109614041 [Musca domestica]
MKITTAKQFEILVSEMEKNPCLAKGFTKGHVPANFKSDWESIATKLNVNGPPIRDPDGWQKVWKDLKFKTKKKLVHNKGETSSTGGGIFKQMILSPLEESVANIMQFLKLLNPPGRALGIENNENISVIDVIVNENEQVDNVDDEADVTTFEASRSSRKNNSRKSTRKEETIELLKEQY